MRIISHLTSRYSSVDTFDICGSSESRLLHQFADAGVNALDPAVRLRCREGARRARQESDAVLAAHFAIDP